MRFFKDSPYSGLTVDHDKVKRIVENLINAKQTEALVVIAGENEGLLAAQVQEILCSTDRIASELIWWVNPEARQKSYGIEMMVAFEYWSREVAKAKYAQVCYLHGMGRENVIRRLYERNGYEFREGAYLKCLY